MAVSLTLLNPLPKAAKFINYTDFDIVPILTTTPIELPLQTGDRMHVAPPSEMYLIDGNNNAYKNILPPPDNYDHEPHIIQEYGKYKVYENIKNTLIYPTVSHGWRLDYFPPTPPSEPEPEKINVKNNSFAIFWISTLLLLIVITAIIKIYRSKYGVESSYNNYTNPFNINV